MALTPSRYNIWVDVEDTSFVYNSLSGELSRTDDLDESALHAYLAGGPLPPGGSESLERLVRAGVIVSDETDELDMIRRRYQAARYSRGLGLTLITSLGCNFDCPYCYEHKEPGLMSAEVQRAIVGLVDDTIPHADGVSVTWLGGEPLLGRDAIHALSAEIVPRCDAAGIDYSASIITNGWLLDRRQAQRLADDRVTFAQVTLDGPPGVHDAYRPKLGGGTTFDRIVDNLEQACDLLDIHVRVNVDRGNFPTMERLLELLAERELQRHITIGPARLVDIAANPLAPAATYTGSTFTPAEFVRAKAEFAALAVRHGFRTDAANLPSQVGTPCTAVNATSVVVGPQGQMWKCWDEVGDDSASIGLVHDYATTSDRVADWLGYVPADDPMCRECVALPVCQGGCLHHGRHGRREDQCGTFRLDHHRRVENAARKSLGLPLVLPTDLTLTASCGTGGGSTSQGTPVTLGRAPTRV